MTQEAFVDFHFTVDVFTVDVSLDQNEFKAALFPIQERGTGFVFHLCRDSGDRGCAVTPKTDANGSMKPDPSRSSPCGAAHDRQRIVLRRAAMNSKIVV